ncbi:uncharacterized protein LOC132700112 [Cylas formicarius]|uniref:uncharacterized protein LOC132700112 n=1 Tax=Cylas formicarius TaxID=197179 RepID=UPI0029583422|nr:uncharacterized protein LOC132700112 [Cylas formicarius]
MTARGTSDENQNGDVTVNVTDNGKVEVVYKTSSTDGFLKAENVERKSASFLYLCAFTAYLTSFSSGVGLSWSSPVFPKMETPENPFSHPLSATQTAWIAASLQLGAAVGPFASGYCADRFGRKRALIFLTVPMLFGNVLLAIAGNVYSYYIARFAVGVGVGSQFAVVPIYLGEIAENHNRGVLGCFLGVFLHVGLAYPLFVGPHVTLVHYALSCAAPQVLFLIIFVIFMPETPQFLLSVGNNVEAEQSLRKLRHKSATEIRKEMEEIRKCLEKQTGRTRAVQVFCNSRSARKALWISVGLVAIKQFSGINPILSFMQTIFQASDSSISPLISTNIIGCVQIFANFACFPIIEKLGRRILLQLSIFGCGMSVMFLGIYFCLKTHQFDVDAIYWLPVTCVFVYFLSFSMGLGFLPWCIMGEVMPPAVKGVGSAITSSASFASSSIVTFPFPIIKEVFGMGVAFLMYAICCLLGMVFVHFCVPETKGKSLSEIQEVMKSKRDTKGDKVLCGTEIIDTMASRECENKGELVEVVYKPTCGSAETRESGLLTPEPEESRKEAFFLYLCAFSAELLTFIGGIGLSWTSPIIPRLHGPENPFAHPITTNQEAWIAAFLPLGAAVGPFAAGHFADKLGRKKALLLISIPMFVGYAILSAAAHVELYYFARFIVGLGVGSSFALVPMYIGEITQTFNRGKFGCFMGLSVVLGLFYPFSIGPHLSIPLYSVCCAVPLVIFFVVFSAFMPESPYFLVAADDHLKAQKVMVRLRPKGVDVNKEVAAIRESFAAENRAAPSFHEVVTSKVLRRAIVAALGLVLLQQFAGINPILSFMKTIFEASGSTISPNVCTVIIGVVEVSSNIACVFVVEKLGRRVLFLGSCLGCFISISALGVYFYLKAHDHDVDSLFWLPVFSLIVYNVFFSLGLGPLPWAVVGEVFPSNIKGFATAVCSGSNFLVSCVITFLFPLISEALGMAGSFWLFGAFCFVGIIFVYYFLPETKGKTLAEIQKMLAD